MESPTLPRNLLKFADKLFPSTSTPFLQALGNRRQRGTILWTKPRPAEMPFLTEERLSWLPDFVDIVSPEVRPGAHLLHEQGAYYCLDLSSVFAASSLQVVSENTTPNTLDVLDLCASPGGKSVFASVSLKPKSLLCNEVIGKRIPKLKSNIVRCGIEAQVVHKDSSIFVRDYPGYFDLVIVDAPCSGQSLITSREEVSGCFHPATINLNSNRQRRIIANASKLVKPGGFLAYMTCTFSKEENEQLVQWFMKKFSNFETVQIPKLTQYQSELCDFYAYRAWPHSNLGLGGFTALLKSKL